MPSQISVRHLAKFYEVPQKERGFLGALRAFFGRRSQTVRAVDDISFEIGEGEVVGFLGPNGAGKTTTLKVLSGLLYPTSGDITVCGFRSFDRQNEFLRQITLVMGQKNQLIWDLPALESFEVNRVIYEIPRADYQAVLKELTDLLDLEPVLGKQVRKLSLGERIKCELAAALLHRPRVLFLDEPTIGLDVTMQARVREFLAEYNRRHGATILLTSHYMADVVALCKRIFVIDRGHLVYDGELDALVERVSPFKYVRIVTQRPLDAASLARFGQVRSVDSFEATLIVPRDRTSAVAAQLFQSFPIEDVTLKTRMWKKSSAAFLRKRFYRNELPKIPRRIPSRLVPGYRVSCLRVHLDHRHRLAANHAGSMVIDCAKRIGGQFRSRSVHQLLPGRRDRAEHDGRLVHLGNGSRHQVRRVIVQAAQADESDHPLHGFEPVVQAAAGCAACTRHHHRSSVRARSPTDGESGALDYLHAFACRFMGHTFSDAIHHRLVWFLDHAILESARCLVRCVLPPLRLPHTSESVSPCSQASFRGAAVPVHDVAPDKCADESTHVRSGFRASFDSVGLGSCVLQRVSF